MSAAEDVATELQNRLGGPPRLTFPEAWPLSGSWHRAQAAPADVSPDETGAAMHVLLGYADDREEVTHHRVLFALLGGELVAECGCPAWEYRRWCAHVAVCWWQWSRSRLGVTDLDTGRVWVTPPPWLRVDDRRFSDDAEVGNGE